MHKFSVVLSCITALLSLSTASLWAQAEVKTYAWDQFSLPNYSWDVFTSLGPDIAVDVNYDSTSLSLTGGKIRFRLTPDSPPPPRTTEAFNFRSEIRTHPWNIQHPLGTEQWIGWRYIFGTSYQVDQTAPITIYQSHHGVEGLSPAVELELAAFNRPFPALGGEIQIANHAINSRIPLPIKPEAGDTLDIVIHLIHGDESEGLLQVWIDGTLQYNVQDRTVYPEYEWGGNSKWGIYHHSHQNNPTGVANTQAEGISEVELFLDTLRILTRTPSDPNYLAEAYEDVRIKGGSTPEPFASSNCSSLNPLEWKHIDLGSVNIAGDVCQSSGAYSVLSAGEGLTDSAKAFHFMYKDLSRDGEITARIRFVGDTDNEAAVGVMIRKDLNLNERYTLLAVTHWGNVISQSRLRPSSVVSSVETSYFAQTFPAWLRLTRTGEKIVMSRSADKVNWVKEDSTFMLHYEDVLIGIASSSSNPNILNEVIVDEITVTGTVIPFPVEFVDFSGEETADNAAIGLTWTTASEENNNFFTLERSKDANAFIPVAEIPSQGNSTSLKTYQFEDKNAFLGVNYYRLKQTDLDGAFTYSKTIRVLYHGQPEPLMVLSPNPVNVGEDIHVQLTNSPDVAPRIQVFDMLGNLLKESIFTEPFQGKISTQNLAGGIYLLRLNYPKKSYVQLGRKIIIR